jgi:heme exporter protein C
MKIKAYLLNSIWLYKNSKYICAISLSISIILIVFSAVNGLFIVPKDYQQGDAFRIIYVHVPCAIFSLFIYTNMAIYSFFYLIFNIKIFDTFSEASASPGAIFTLCALLTGSIWGKPMWGTWWVWDARLTSELILLFLYIGYISIRFAINDPERKAKFSSVLILIGFIDIPIIHYSVEWWFTLHQGPSITKFSKPSIETEMLVPLLTMCIGFFLFYLSIMLIKSRSIMLIRNSHKNWVRRVICDK